MSVDSIIIKQMSLLAKNKSMELQAEETGLRPHRYIYINPTQHKEACLGLQLALNLIMFVKLLWQILIRFPNGERRENTFLSTDKIQSIFSFIDSLGMPGIENYRLISNFPRRAYGVDQMRMTLKDAGLYPKASLFLEPI